MLDINKEPWSSLIDKFKYDIDNDFITFHTVPFGEVNEEELLKFCEILENTFKNYKAECVWNSILPSQYSIKLHKTY